MKDVKRTGTVRRATKETKIDLSLAFDGGQSRSIHTGIGFFDHLLDLMAAHGFMDIELRCDGDSHIDAHHSVEDVGIAMGQAIAACLGDKAGIRRYASVYLPMDEALAFVALDCSGRAYLLYDVPIAPGAFVGEMDAQLFEEFFRALAQHAGLTLHIRVLYGRNLHHMLEAIAKTFGRCLADAASDDPRNGGAIPSTKGAFD